MVNKDFQKRQKKSVSVVAKTSLGATVKRCNVFSMLSDLLITATVAAIFSQTWLRYVWLMAWQIRLSSVMSVVCDMRAPYF